MRLPRAGGAEGVERALFGDRGAQFGGMTTLVPLPLVT